MQYPEPVAKLIDSYMHLPGIGEKKQPPGWRSLQLIWMPMLLKIFLKRYWIQKIN